MERALSSHQVFSQSLTSISQFAGSVASTDSPVLTGALICPCSNRIASVSSTLNLLRKQRILLSGWQPVHVPRLGRTGRPVASVEEVAIDNNELFKDAAKAGDLNRVRELISSGGVDINLPSPLRAGWTALQLGAYYEHPEVTSYLLWAGADTEGRNNSGNTALQLACLKGNVEIARLLLDAGADIDAVSNDKGTPIEYAQEWGGEEIVDFLLLWAAQNRSIG